MTLKDMMADHLTSVFLNTDHFAEAGVYKPANQANTFALTLTIGDVTDQMQILVDGRADQRQITGTGLLATIRAGILAAIGTVRDPQHGDTWTIAAGANAGVWSVVLVGPDEGGGVVLTLRREKRHEVAASKVVENR